jgi:hypothetical protein
MKLTETVVEVTSNKVGTISEITETVDGKKYLVDFDGTRVWKEESDIKLFLTSEQTHNGGELLNG